MFPPEAYQLLSILNSHDFLETIKKKIKLKKWQEYTLSAIMVLLAGWLVYLTFLS